MRKLIYKIEGYTGVYNPETKETEQLLTLAEVTVGHPTEADITKAAEVAYNGEYTVEDDGQPEPEAVATADDVLDALLGVTE